MILDSTYLIDFERECRADEHGPAHDLLQRYATTRLHIPFAALGELAAGYPVSRADFEDAMRPFTVLWPSMDVCWSYAETYRFLRRTTSGSRRPRWCTPCRWPPVTRNTSGVCPDSRSWPTEQAPRRLYSSSRDFCSITIV